MRLRGITVEDFCNYKVPSLFLASAFCNMKCNLEQGAEVCQNSTLALFPLVTVDDDFLYRLYANNDITKAVVIGGLEPFDQFDELKHLIACFRDKGESCVFVIYSGYYPEEIQKKLNVLSGYDNIIVKFGRYLQGNPPVYDDTLGVTLASNNQYARRIS